jgi:molybdopterin converting factor small subunit
LSEQNKGRDLPKVKLIVYGSAQERKVSNIELRGRATVKDLILVFSSQVWEGFAETIYSQEANRVHNSVLVFINDKAISPLVALDTPLEQGDTISIVYALAGG